MPAPLRHSSAGRAATLTMRPPAPVRAMALTAARQHRKAVTKFMSTCCIRSDRVVSATGFMAKPPARWIDAHSGDTSPNRRATDASSDEIGDRDQLDLRMAAQREAFGFRRLHIGHVADGAGLDQRAGDRGPERAGPAGHDHMAIGEVHRCLLRLGPRHVYHHGMQVATWA